MPLMTLIAEHQLHLSAFFTPPARVCTGGDLEASSFTLYPSLAACAALSFRYAMHSQTVVQLGLRTERQLVILERL